MVCPWSSFTQTALEFCEANLCAWVKEPANTFSNLAYIIVGLVIALAARKHRRPLLIWMGLVSIVTGFASAFYHASGVRIAGIADYFAMFLGTGVMTSLNVRRWLAPSRQILRLVFLGTTVTLIVLSIVAPGSERWLYILAMPCCFIEGRLFFRDRARTIYRNYLIAWAFILIGVLAWWLDISGTLCDPNNHWFQGHALWHITTLLSALRA